MEQDKTRLLKFFEHAWTIVFVKSHSSLAIIYLSNYDNIHTHTVKREEITMLYEHKRLFSWIWQPSSELEFFLYKILFFHWDPYVVDSTTLLKIREISLFLFFNILNPLSFSLLLKVFCNLIRKVKSNV